MILPEIKIYEGNDLSGPVLDVMFLNGISGSITEILLIIGGNAAEDAVFNITKNGTALFTGTDRLTVAAGTLMASKTGLSITVTETDVLQLDLEECGAGGVAAPITLILKVDDGQSGGLSVEEVQDIVGAMLVSGSHSVVTYNDAAGTVTVDSIQLTDEEVQDKVGAFLSGGANTTVTYNDGANTLVVAETTAGKTTEEIQDIVAALLAQGSNITLTYNDAGNVLTIAASGGGGGSLPTGGTAGQVLTKQSGTDGDADWKTLQIGYKKVNWTNLVNCTDNGDSDASERGMLTKGSGTGTAWNAGAGSVESFSTGKLRVVFDNVNFAAFWGLATTNVVAADPSWTALPISIFNNNGTCRYSQNGTFLEEFSIAAYDVIEIEVIRMNGNNHLVRLWKNNDPLGNVHSLSGRSEPQYYAMCSLVTPNQIFGAPDMLKNT